MLVLKNHINIILFFFDQIIDSESQMIALVYTLRFSYPGKRGKPDFMATPKLYSGSKIVLKSNYFI